MIRTKMNGAFSRKNNIQKPRITKNTCIVAFLPKIRTILSDALDVLIMKQSHIKFTHDNL